MADITQIKKMLIDRAQQVAETLLPRGKLVSGEWCVGSINGEKGQSLKVCVRGAKIGVWADFATGDGGDLIDLWKDVKGITLADAFVEVKQYLGVKDPDIYRGHERQYNRPKKPKCQEPKDAVYSYLSDTRGIPGKMLQIYKIGEDGRHAIFPFMVSDQLVLAKRYPIDANEKGKRPPVPTERDCEPVLFGWQAISDDAREIVITEGELDAMSMYAFGFPAVSVPFGGGGGLKQQWIQNDFERLARFDKIYVATDMDHEGDLAADEIIRRLGIHRCLRVRLPKKDANECLTSGISADEIAECMENAEYLKKEGIGKPSDYTEDVEALFRPVDGRVIGACLPLSFLNGKVVFQPGELTLWSGASNHGKSQILSFSTVHWAWQGEISCIASLEMHPKYTLKRMVKQAGNLDVPSPEMLNKTMQWLDNGTVILEHLGKVSVDSLIESFDYCLARFGCTQFVIDSLMRLGVASDDYVGQEAIVFKLVTWAAERNVHVHLVAHTKKANQDAANRVPELEDIKGASEIGANAHNAIMIWRNKKHEDELSKAEMTSDQAKLNELSEKTGVILNVAKQRNGDWSGKVGLHFDTKTYQYAGTGDNRNGMQYFTMAER